MAKEKGSTARSKGDLINRETFKQLCLERGLFSESLEEALYDCPDADAWINAKEELPEADFEKHFEINGEYPSYMVKIREGVEAAMLHYDGEVWHDERGEVYAVDWWQELPRVPRE